MDKRFLSALLVTAAVAGGAANTPVASIAATVDPANGFVTYSGTATDERTGQFLYRENHVLRYRDRRIAERVVLYNCRDGTAFARKTASYTDPLTPDFLLEDASNGMREGIHTDGGLRKVFFRSDRDSAEKTGLVPQAPGLVADSGFDAFVRTHWQSLMRGDALRMDFLVPSRLDDLGFKVQHIRSTQMDGMPVEEFRLKVSGLVGWVAPSIDVYYGASDHLLVRYVGLSDLRDASNDNFKAQITFPTSDRKIADANALADARQAPLGGCR